MTRRAARRDANHKDVAATFRALGCSVFETDRVGEGFPDLVIGMAGANLLVELKNPETHYGRGGLSKSQTKFNDAWRGDKVIVITSPDEAAAFVLNRRRNA